MTTPNDQPVDQQPEAGFTPFAPRAGMWSDGTGDVSGFSHVVQLPERIQPLSRPYGGRLDEIIDRLIELVPAVANAPVVGGNDMATIFIPREHLVAVMYALRDDQQLRYEMCSSVSGVHYPDDKDSELHVVYHLLSMTMRHRLRIEVTAPDGDPHIPSVVAVYPGMNYHEREVWDMFGVIFDGHPGLTRILMPDDWDGHPQRKDYNLGGIPIEFNGADVPPVQERRRYR